MSKLTKQESGYVTPPKKLWSPSKKGIRCGTCKFYRANGCAIVEGYIHPQDCCNLWTTEGRELNTDFICGQDIEDIIQ